MNEHRGRCACSATEYALRGVPKFSYFCQCSQCQKATGTGHAALMMVRTEDLVIHGPIRFFDRHADSGNVVSRGFCSVCGTPMVLKGSGYPHLRFLPVGSLDDPALFQPTRVLWHSAAQPWDPIGDGLTVHMRGVK